jgi:predicted XRE-type DNA-binding protein
VKEELMAIRVQRSSGNVFSDLGFSADEAENLKIRADLMIELTKLLERKGFTQVEAAKFLGVTQRRVSDLMRGKIDRFSADSLIEMLGQARAYVSL